MRLPKILPSKTVLRLLGALLVAASALTANAQAASAIDKDKAPRFEAGIAYTYFHANAPPGGCGCFSLNGGGGDVRVNLPHGLSVVGDFSAAHASTVNGTPQNITLFDYLFGPRFTYRPLHHFSLYVQALVGSSIEHSNYAYAQNISGLAALGGGGLNHAINHWLGWNILEADYLYSRVPNANNNTQNDLRIKTGLYLRFGTR